MYATRADMVRRFGEGVLIDLTDHDNQGVIDDQVLEQALADASAEIDSYVSARYDLPLAEVPPLFRRMAINLARYQLDHQPDETVTKRRDDAIAYLQKVAVGKASLGVAQTSEPTSLDTVEIQSAGSVFSRKNGRDFI